MISQIGSQGYTQSASRVQRSDAQPVEARSRNTNAQESAAQSAAVVRIGSDARAQANEAAGARSRLGSDSEPRAQIEIQPVVAQPVPDFNAPKADAVTSTDRAQTNGYQLSANGYQSSANGYQSSANGYQSPTSGYQVVA